MPPWRREFDDASTGPVLLRVGEAPEYPRSRSVAEQVVAALAPPLPPQPTAATSRLSAGHLRLLLVVLLAGTVAASIAIAVHPRGLALSGQDVALDTRGGDCLTWPDGAPNQATVVDCATSHLFEVAATVDLDGVPDQPGFDTAHRVDQAFAEACPPAASRYLGSRLDPGGRFVVGMVWSPSGPQPQAGGRLVCGLQLRSDGTASHAFLGRVAEQDQSNVWPSGTCLGIQDGQATDIPVDCATAHAMEIIGTANLSDRFVDAPPSVAGQDAAVRDICTAKIVDYLAPRSLAETTLSLHYTPISSAGWVAGSRWVACRLASTEPDGRWASLLGAVRSGVLIDGVAPALAVEPPTIAPAEAVNNTEDTPAPPAPAPRPAVPSPAGPPSPAPGTDVDPPPVPGPEAVAAPPSEPPPVEAPAPRAVAAEPPAALPEPPATGPLPGPPPDQQNS